MRTFYVERVSRCVTTVIVQAASKAEAKRLVSEGHGVESDSEYTHKGFGKIEQEPER